MASTLHPHIDVFNLYYDFFFFNNIAVRTF